MEQLLENIIKDTAGQAKLEAVTGKARTGLEFLESYSRAPASQYRPVFSTLIGPDLTRLGSHWSRSNEAWLSLVQI